MSDHNDPFDELMRRALREEADRIEPTDALPEIRARAQAQRRPVSRRPRLITAGVAVAGAAAAIGAFTVFTGDQNLVGDGNQVAGHGTATSTTGLPATETPSITKASPSPVPTEPSQTSKQLTPPSATTGVPTDRGLPERPVKGALVPVYWLGANVGTPTKKDTRLYRTYARVDGRPAFEAVRIMTQQRPGDPDYYSAWDGAEVNTVTLSKDLVTVDFKELPPSHLDAATATVAAQQLVYTVQGAMQDSKARVQVTLEGRPGSKLFGQVDTSRPLSRAQQAQVQAFIWVTSPEENAYVKAPFKVTGVASAYEAQLNWRIVNVKSRQVVAEGIANTSEAYKFTPFAFSVSKLAPGAYSLQVFELSANDGRMASTDTKSLIVR